MVETNFGWKIEYNYFLFEFNNENYWFALFFSTRFNR